MNTYIVRNVSGASKYVAGSEILARSERTLELSDEQVGNIESRPRLEVERRADSEDESEQNTGTDSEEVNE